MGQSSSQTTQQSQSGVGAQASPEVQGLLSNLTGLEGNTGLTSGESGAINTLTGMGASGNPYATGTTGAVNSLLNGGGATNETGTINQAYQNYQAAMAPYTSPTYSTVNSAPVQAALQTANDDVTNQVNGQFAAAGRSGSGMNTQTLARGIAQADAPIILNQANQDTATRIGAANSVYGAGNTTANTIAGMNQNAVTNQNAGINAVGTALQNSTWGPQTELTAQELGQSLPASNLGLLTQIGVPLAQLYGTSNGTSNTQNNPSLIQDVASLGGIGAGPSTGLGGVKSAGSGILGLLGMI